MLLLFKSSLSQIERDLSESFLSHTVSCDWPVRNTRRYWPEFHGHYTVHDN